MRPVAIVLLAGVFIANDTANWLSARFHFSPAAMFYMLQGWWVLTLSVVLLVFVLVYPPSIWRSISIFALAVSIAEGLQITICRAAIDDINRVPSGVNLCDHVTGLPIGAATTTLYVTVLAWIVGAWILNRREEG